MDSLIRRRRAGPQFHLILFSWLPPVTILTELFYSVTFYLQLRIDNVIVELFIGALTLKMKAFTGMAVSTMAHLVQKH